MTTSEVQARHRRVKLSVDVDPEFRQRLRLAAVRRDVPLREFLIAIVEERLGPVEGGEEEHVRGRG